jgi:hypothetical protein
MTCAPSPPNKKPLRFPIPRDDAKTRHLSCILVDAGNDCGLHIMRFWVGYLLEMLSQCVGKLKWR